MNQSTFDQLKDMIIQVAEALGSDILRKTAFVGGATTGFLLTDELAQESVRSTDDVDLIVSTLGYVQNAEFEQTLRERGFIENPEDNVICRKWLNDIQVDFMPTDETLGFTNRWYAAALEQAQDYELKPGLVIRLLTPAYFLATKLEAFKGRGADFLWESRDLEDIVSLIDGRDTLIEDIKTANKEMLAYISTELDTLHNHTDFDYLLQSATNGDEGRMEYLHEQIDGLVRLGNEQ
ncbi:hypothetical protein [uncultured Shewanella sp.]|uniref:hypothetical protein n=1 Tax=uncultured Shewanella sp. TaxID=173975 RepID=UPI0026368D49|nr:hypothetical protein [uncultured Shewanella sp.]